MRDSRIINGAAAVLSVLASFYLYSLLGSVSPDLIYVINLFSIIVLIFAVEKGGLAGAVMGTVCGLIQDSFSMGVFGVAGLTKTLMGYTAGAVSRRIDVSKPMRNFLFVVVLSALEMIVWAMTAALVRRQPIDLHHGLMLAQPVVTAVSVSFFLHLENKIRRRRG